MSTLKEETYLRRLKLVFEQLTDTSPIEPQEYLGMHREQIEGVLTAKQIYKEQKAYPPSTIKYSLFFFVIG